MMAEPGDRVSPWQALEIGHRFGLSDARIKAVLEAGVTLKKIEMRGAKKPTIYSPRRPRPPFLDIWAATADPDRCRSFSRCDVEAMMLLASAEIETLCPYPLPAKQAAWPRPVPELSRLVTHGPKKGLPSLNKRKAALARRAVGLLKDGVVPAKAPLQVIAEHLRDDPGLDLKAYDVKSIVRVISADVRKFRQKGVFLVKNG
jgi:hypothetical protein